MNQEAADPGPPVVPAVTSPSINSYADSVDALLLSSPTSSSRTPPLPLELHIDEDGASAGSTVVLTTSKFSQIQQRDDAVSLTSESISVSTTQSFLSQPEVSSTQISGPPEKSSSPGPAAQSSSPVVVSKSPSPGSMLKNTSPVLRAESPSPPDFKFSNLSQPHKSPSSQGPAEKDPTEPKISSPVTAPRFSSPVPKSASPVTVPNFSSPTTVPKSSSPEPVPKCSSPVSIPRLSSPVTIPHISSSPTVPRHSSPVTVPKSPASLTRKTYTLPGTSSPRASPVSLGAVPPNTQAGEAPDLTWPCREPLLDDALDRILAPNSPPGSVIPGDEDRSWEDEDGVYPDLSRDGAMTPMTESSWIEECFTPSTCPGTPDATLELPIQQPSAVERLSASGQVGGSTQLFQNKI